MGLVRPQSGMIRVCGTDAMDSREEAMSHIGCLIEAPALYDYMTAEQNLELAARFYKDVDSQRIQDVLYMVDMHKYKKDKVRSFSLGMRQRVGFAAALISRPRLLILDEPANALDIEGMMYVREVIKAASAEGCSVLVSSHLANEIQLCATKAAVMHSGRLLALDSMDAILGTHGTLEEFFLSEVGKMRGFGGLGA